MKLLFVLLLAAATQAMVRYDGYRVVKVGPLKDQNEWSIVQKLVDDDERIRQVMMLGDVVSTKAPVELAVSPEAFAMVESVLTRNNIPLAVINNDLQATFDANMAMNSVARKRFQDDITLYEHDAYLTYNEQVAWLEAAAAGSASIAQTVSLGTSYEGRDMVGIQINHGTALPSIWIDSNIHAREWISSATTLWIIDEILTGTSADAVYLRDNFRWYIFPMVNPDGYEWTWTNNRMHRKTRSPNAGSLCVGTDPNRNWDVNWCGEGASTDPCSDTYCGSSAFSEDETANMRDFLTGIASSTNIMISVHCYSQLWLVPWGSYTDKPADYNELMRVGNLAADAIQATNGRQFTVGTPPDILYVASGGSFDWTKQALLMAYSYSPELRPATAAQGGFDIPATNIIPSGQEIFAAVVVTAREAAQKV